MNEEGGLEYKPVFGVVNGVNQRRDECVKISSINDVDAL